MSRPGDRIRSFASRVFAEQTMTRVVDPILSDLQCEYDEALARGAAWRARLSLVRSYAAFARALLWLGIGWAWHADEARAGVARTCLVFAVSSAMLTLALAVPPLLGSRGLQGDPAFATLLFITLVPQALPLSIPAGLCVAVLWTARGKAVTWRGVATVLAIALVFTAVVWVVLEWLMPQANQEFRDIVVARLSNGRPVALEPGLNELGLSRLGQRIDPSAVRHYHLLWALCFASAPLGVLAAALARYVRRAVPAVVLAVVLSNLYFVIVWVCAASAVGRNMPASMAAWTPNAVFVLMACALLARRPAVPATPS